MANEISLGVSLQVSNDPYVLTINKSKSIDCAYIGEGGGVQIIGTSAETVDLGDISYPGYVYLENLDSTNYVDYGPDSGGMVTMGRLLAGECAVLRLAPSGVTLKAQANTADVKLLVRCLEAGT